MKHAGPLVALVAAAGTAAALLLGATGAVAETADGPRPDSAFGLAATGLVPIGPTPYVESRDGDPVARRKVQLGSIHDGVGTGALSVEAEQGKADASATQLRFLSYFSADLVHTFCENGSGGLEIANGLALGHRIPSGTLHDRTIPLGPLGEVTLGRQVHHDDGSTTVTGVVLTLFPGVTDPGKALTPVQKAALPDLGLPADLTTVGDALGALSRKVPGVTPGAAVQTVTIGSTTCHPHHHQDEGDDHGGDTGQAPKPKIVEAHLPVTG